MPVATLTAPSSALIGSRLNLSVDFQNASPTTTGYGPYIDVVLPATGEDGPIASIVCVLARTP
jgi:hypothetical protein